MGREGRTLCGGLAGRGHVILGLTGLVLWWPQARSVEICLLCAPHRHGPALSSRAACRHRHLDLLRLHGGEFFRRGAGLAADHGRASAGLDPRALPTVEASDGKPPGRHRSGDRRQRRRAGLASRAASPSPPRPISRSRVNYLSHGAINATVYVDPYRGKVLAVRDPSAASWPGCGRCIRAALGPVWKFLVFLSGLVPTLFVVTGMIMWGRNASAMCP